VIDDGAKFRWRLIGMHIVRFAGTDDAGRFQSSAGAPFSSGSLAFL